MNQDDEHRENGSSKRHMFCSTERVFMAAAPGEQTNGVGISASVRSAASARVCFSCCFARLELTTTGQFLADQAAVNFLQNTKLTHWRVT